MKIEMLRSLLLLLIAATSVFAQSPPIAAQEKAAPLPPLPPWPPAQKSFRQVLAMNAAEREQFLSTRTPEQRQILQERVREYEALPPLEREARLCSLGLRLYLRPLMEVPLTNRLERLAAVPQPERKLVEERLQFWDRLPSEAQAEFLTNEWLLRYILRPETSPQNQDQNVPNYVRIRIEEAIGGWNQLPGAKRREILENFKQIFEFSEKEKAKILDEFGDAERLRMQRTLEAFERLPKSQRERCVNGFQKFAGLTLQERQQFLSNVELWQRMDAKDRLAWRVLVGKISFPKPPPPPGLNDPPTPPQTLQLPPKRPAVVTTN